MKVMTTGESKAKLMIGVFNAIYNKRGITFACRTEGQYIVITMGTTTKVYRDAISYNRFVAGDEELISIYNDIEKDLATCGLLQGDSKALIEARRHIEVLEEQLTGYANNNLELHEKIELQESVIQELKHIIEMNGMNTRKRG